MLFDNVNDTIVHLMSAADKVNKAVKWTKKENSGSEFPSFSDDVKIGMVSNEDNFDCSHDDCKPLTEVCEHTFNSVFATANKLYT